MLVSRSNNADVVRNLPKATEGTVGTIYGLSNPSINHETETADSATSNHANSNNRHHWRSWHRQRILRSRQTHMRCLLHTPYSWQTLYLYQSSGFRHLFKVFLLVWWGQTWGICRDFVRWDSDWVYWCSRVMHIFDSVLIIICVVVVWFTARDKATKNSFFLKLKIVNGGEQGETSEVLCLPSAKLQLFPPHIMIYHPNVLQTKLAVSTYRNYGTPPPLSYLSNWWERCPLNLF